MRTARRVDVYAGAVQFGESDRAAVDSSIDLVYDSPDFHRLRRARSFKPLAIRLQISTEKRGFSSTGRHRLPPHRFDDNFGRGGFAEPAIA